MSYRENIKRVLKDKQYKDPTKEMSEDKRKDFDNVMESITNNLKKKYEIRKSDTNK